MADTAFLALRVAVLTVSDTRSEADDRSGSIIGERLVAAGHRIVERAIVTDDGPLIRDKVRSWLGTVDVVVTTGGTGITARDVTPDALAPLITKTIPGFGELFRQLSYADIGASTIQSRALAGVCGTTLLFVLPGSTGACRLALEKILEPQLDQRTRPCNFAQLLPRLREVGPAPTPASASPGVTIHLADGPLGPPGPWSVEGAGAIVAFDGVVRLLEEGRELAALSYEHYEGMVEPELKRLAKGIVDEFDVLAIDVHHSRGRVPVGATSFRLRVAGRHRKEALQAMDAFIDRMKADVPIWKHPEHPDD